MRIKQEMYGIKQADILSYKQLVKHLKTYGYHPVICTNSIFPHKTRNVFCLCVDDFGIKYHSTDNAGHMLNSIKENILLSLIGKGIIFTV